MSEEEVAFRLPIKLLRTPGGFKIVDAAREEIAFFYSKHHPTSGGTSPLPDPQKCEAVAKTVARLIRKTGFPKY